VGAPGCHNMPWSLIQHMSPRAAYRHDSTQCGGANVPTAAEADASVHRSDGFLYRMIAPIIGSKLESQGPRQGEDLSL
jgi:hypothetical protein